MSFDSVQARRSDSGPTRSKTDDPVGAAPFRIQLTFIASPLTLGVDIREFVMSETEVISRRRALSFLGLAALAAVVPAAILPISEAEAQQPSPPTAPPAGSPPAGAPPAGAQTGTERRQQRRTARTERRQERRMSRTKRRQSRRTGRKERRQQRRSPGAT